MGLSTSFSTDGVPDGLRSARFREHMRRWFAVELDLTPPERGLLDVQMRGFRGERLRFASFSFSPHVTRFGGRRRPTEPRLLVSLLRRGSAQVWQSGRTAHFTAGQMLLIDPSEPFVIDSDAIETTSLYIAPDVLRVLDPRVRLMTAAPLDDVGMSGLFQRVAREVVRLAPSLPQGQADGLVDVLGAALRSTVEAQPRPSGVVRLGAGRQKGRVQAFVLAHLPEPDLTVVRVAAETGVSARRLQQLFVEDGGLMRWVWTQRLERCRAWLTEEGRRHLTVSQIAFAWGFSDSAHFSRAFRRRFDCAPSALRGRADA